MSTQSNPTNHRHGNHRIHFVLYLSLAVIAAAASVVALHRSAADTLILTSPASVRAGSTVNLPLTLKTSSKDLSALQWQIDLPPGTVAEATSSVDGKIAQCYKQRCILYGGVAPISSGVIANLSVHIPDAATDLSIGLHDVLGATSEAASRKIEDTRLTLKVQH